ncbi:MAG: hypothetical protein LUH05_04250 [Candidatus Gastranaerophilales bacterium]|nr:hypothetical protein [Candidatus Gastranaerophilales bacterium]
MIQAPQTQYIPAGEPIQNNYQQQGAYNPVQYTQNQTPGVFYNYPTTSCYTPAQQPQSAGTPQYNGVNIEILNPQGQSVTGQGSAPYCMPAQFVPVQQQTPIYAPQVQQPVQQQISAPQAQQPIQQPVEQPVSQIQQPAPQIQQPVQQPVQQQTETPQAAAPVIEQPTVASDPNLVESFAGKLKTDDLDAQRAGIEELAENVKNNDQTGDILLDTQLYDALLDIINKDTSSLEAPSPEVVELRQKDENQLTAEEKEKASTPSPLEKAEINKQYALYTISYMDERLNNQLVQNGKEALELKDLPCVENIIDTVKGNENPMLRISGIAALSHLQRPEYKEDLTTIFNLARTDEDEGVKESAEKALTAIGVNPQELPLPNAAAPTEENSKKQ